MANHLAGPEGVVKNGANTIAEVRGWSIEQQADTVEDTVIGDISKTYKSSLTSWSGSLSAFWDETDTNGQVAMTIGASITLNLYPEGATTGDSYFTGTAIITGITNKGEVGGMVEAEFTFQGTGALTIATAA
jgi:hypothetical protein